MAYYPHETAQNVALFLVCMLAVIALSCFLEIRKEAKEKR